MIKHLYLTGTCGLASTLQGITSIPIISDSNCASRWGSGFRSSSMICVYNGSQGACNVHMCLLHWCFKFTYSVQYCYNKSEKIIYLIVTSFLSLYVAYITLIKYRL